MLSRRPLYYRNNIYTLDIEGEAFLIFFSLLEVIASFIVQREGGGRRRGGLEPLEPSPGYASEYRF